MAKFISRKVSNYSLPIIVGILLLMPDICLAYIGPGSGITMIGSLLAVAIAIILTVIGVLFWPLRLLIKLCRRRKNKPCSVADGETGTSPDDH